MSPRGSRYAWLFVGGEDGEAGDSPGSGPCRSLLCKRVGREGRYIESSLRPALEPRVPGLTYEHAVVVFAGKKLQIPVQTQVWVYWWPLQGPTEHP